MNILRFAEVCRKIGLSASSFRRLRATGQFPQPVQLTDSATGWRADQVDDWIASRPIAPRSKPQAGPKTRLQPVSAPALPSPARRYKNGHNGALVPAGVR